MSARLDDLSVKVKILVAVGLAALVAAFVGLTGYFGMASTSDSANLIYESNVASIRAVAQLKSAAVQARVDTANQALSTDETRVREFTEAFTADVEAFETAMTAYRGTLPAGDPAVIDHLQSVWDSWVTVANEKLIPAGLKNDLDGWAAARDADSLPLLKQIYDDLATLDQAETADAASNAASAQSTYQFSRNLSFIVLFAGLAVAMTIGYFVAARIVRSLTAVKAVCDALAAGDLTRATGLTSRDETGRMGQSLDTAMASLRDTVITIEGSASTLASATEEMTGTAAQIAVSAEEASRQSQDVSSAAEEISRSVDTVSAGSEEMGASIREISQNASEAAQVAAEAVGLAAATSSTMNKLGDSSAEIGNVIKVITSIAEQTNLLALNATIEAARAGDAGKGFAVVASEVKDLAQETARATEDISRRVEAIQADTEGAVDAIEKITAVIARISDFQTTIASAVEEQTATTAEMNRSVSEAATGTGDISRSITGVAQAAQNTSQGVSETQHAISDLARMSTDLSGLVSRFRV
ncbi:methyl-accepting chemotaxis protein [Actinoplanes sp. NBC_00393]|uniref:methyl-accepting chemotaxis protein n=1 Tax=Actinoplanes sp. NBC_00393 TaxID=2975953 RepID=UPI002E251274